MKALIGSLAGVALLATPALAQTTNTMSSGAKATTKTMVTKGAKSTATTTVTTKVTPNKSKMRKHHAKAKMHKVAPKKMTKTTTTKS